MIERAVPMPPNSPGPVPPPSTDPWALATTLEPGDLDPQSLPVLPDFGSLPEEVLLQLLPPPLQDQFLLSRHYVRLLQGTPQLPREVFRRIVQTLRHSAADLGGAQTDFGAAVALLAQALEEDRRQEARLREHFEKLQERFQQLPAKEREWLFNTLQELIEVCELAD